jgi:Cu-Zn family superoxide dismutase
MSCVNAVAIFDQDNVKGTIRFHQCAGSAGSNVYIDLYSLVPNKTRAIHIHEYGDEREGCISLGSHWNPLDKTHGTIEVKNMPRHSGDLINNISPNSKGKYSYKYYDPLVNLMGNVNDSIIGRSVVIHDGTDDLGLGGNPESLKTGNAGSRIACAIIARAKDGKVL